MLANYTRCLATMALYFKRCPLELDEEQVLDYLYYLKTQRKSPSASYFKHTVYGLRYAYKIMGLPDKRIALPPMNHSSKLPVILSKEEIKRLLVAPRLLKHRIILALLYDCGLRRSELLNIKLPDVDLDRRMLHVREGKGKKDRYVPIGMHLARGLQSYMEAEKPYVWLFNGRNNTGQLKQFSGAGLRWILKQNSKRAGIKKQVTSHVLRHTYATHLLEMGLDIMTLRDMLGHVDIKTTMIYLHIAQLGRGRAFNPIDRLYPN